jgi:hypothetical protein
MPFHSEVTDHSKNDTALEASAILSFYDMATVQSSEMK